MRANMRAANTFENFTFIAVNRTTQDRPGAGVWRRPGEAGGVSVHLLRRILAFNDALFNRLNGYPLRSEEFDRGLNLFFLAAE